VFWNSTCRISGHVDMWRQVCCVKGLIWLLICQLYLWTLCLDCLIVTSILITVFNLTTIVWQASFVVYKPTESETRNQHFTVSYMKKTSLCSHSDVTTNTLKFFTYVISQKQSKLQWKNTGDYSKVLHHFRTKIQGICLKVHFWHL